MVEFDPSMELSVNVLDKALPNSFVTLRYDLALSPDTVIWRGSLRECLLTIISLLTIQHFYQIIW